MKIVLHALTILVFLLSGKINYAQFYNIDLVDIDGNVHNIQEDLDNGTPVFILHLSSGSQSWQAYNHFEIIELYNNLGQGGSSNVKVFIIANSFFQSPDDLENLDFSDDLGPGYVDLSYTENNPIPLLMNVQNPDLPLLSEFGYIEIYCPENGMTYPNYEEEAVAELMQVLYNECCTALEYFDPALSAINNPLAPDCEPSQIEFTFQNTTANSIDSCQIEVIRNGVFFDLIIMLDTVPGCSSTTIEYENEIISPGDTMVFAISQENAAMFNDTTDYIIIEPVDTVRGHIRTEVLSPQEGWFVASTQSNSVTPAVNFGAQAYSNFYSDLFLTEGCHTVQVSFDGGDTDLSDGHLQVTSRNQDGSIEKTLVDTMGNDYFWSYYRIFNLFIDDEANQQAWGWVYEDLNDDQTFHPDLPRIPGIQVNQGSYTTFTDIDGYYNFPQLDGWEPISIEYDATNWPVFTTPNSGNISTNSFIHSFGLLNVDPIWEIDAFFNAGNPYLCEWGISQSIYVSNTGNQPISAVVEFTHDENLELIQSNPNPIAQNGNTLTFEVPPLGYNEFYNIWTHFDTVPADLYGQVFTASYELVGYDGNQNVIGTDSQTLADTLFCAYDPNDIFGFPMGNGPVGLIPANTPLKYRIRFQNTGNMSASTVVVVDTIPPELNWDSFVPLHSSHDYQIVMNGNTREVKWVFNGINLPDSASDPLGSQGYIWYDIEMNNLEVGEQIQNQAHIFFDQNPPISTNISLHTIDSLQTGLDENQLRFDVYPNPVNAAFIVQTETSGTHIIEICDIRGIPVLRKNVSTSQFQVDASDWAPGVYFISVTNSTSKVRNTKRLVKL